MGVKIVGWGKELETFYWVVQNSWGSSWGENGFFRIKNWHDDMESAIAIGCGYACLQGATPPPPGPATSPVTCDDIASYCSDYDKTQGSQELPHSSLSEILWMLRRFQTIILRQHGLAGVSWVLFR